MAPDNRRARWADRVQVPEGARLAWYGPGSSADDWLDYWRSRLHPGYHQAARSRDVRRHPLGRILLTELDPAGLHLEAGCGAGFWVAALAAAGYRVEGIEGSAGLVALVKAADPGLPVRHGDVLAIDRPDGHYDSYLSFGVVEHRREGPEPFLAEAYRVLRDGGVLVLSVPHYGRTRRLRARTGRYQERAPDGAAFYQYGFSLPELSRLVEEAGFEVTGARPIEPHRLLEEESRLYERVSAGPLGPWARRATERVLDGRDGHMAVVVAKRSNRR